ncbi:MAG TPA: hypothetical protein VHI52_03225 [Verrucomicrobiae bacterium]|nr:hypothetical protein [Verrucomicrobiae bacterium]
MKPLRWLSTQGVALLGLFLLAAFLPGCSKQNKLVLDSASFSTAPADLKDNWQAASQSVESKDYLGAATNLVAIFNKGQQLTAEQKDALNQAWTKLGNLAFAAANNGDKNATEAVLKMKETGIDDRRSR